MKGIVEMTGTRIIKQDFCPGPVASGILSLKTKCNFSMFSYDQGNNPVPEGMRGLDSS